MQNSNRSFKVIHVPGRPRSPRSPLGPTVPLQWEQRQKKGISLIGGGLGELNSMSQIDRSGKMGMSSSLIIIRVMLLGGPGMWWWRARALKGKCPPLSSESESESEPESEPEFEPEPLQSMVLSTPKPVPGAVLFSMAEQREQRARIPSSLDNIWRKTMMMGAQRVTDTTEMRYVTFWLLQWATFMCLI